MSTAAEVPPTSSRLLIIILALLLAAHGDAVINPFRLGLRTERFRLLGSAGFGPLETVVVESLRLGLSAGSFDMLERARQLDKDNKASSNSKQLFGAPVLLVDVDAFLSPLMEQGALVFRESTAVDSPHGRPHLNPRDNAFLLDAAPATSTTRAIEGVASGKVVSAIVSSPTGEGAPLFPISLCWTGLVGVRLPASAAEGGSAIICAPTLADVLLMRSLLLTNAGKNYLADIDESSVKPKPLKGYKIACLSDRMLTDVDKEAQIEPSVKAAAEVFAEMLERLGAECKFMKLGTFMDPQALLDAGYCAVASPASLTAALSLTSRGDFERVSSAQISPPNAFTENLSVTFPVGLVAGDDDGYDDSLNEEKDREGLPINICITALSPADEDKAIDIAAHYTRATRWSSEVFSLGATRQQAAEDMDDAREVFGIFFVKTLLMYLGKKKVL